MDFLIRPRLIHILQGVPDFLETSLQKAGSRGSKVWLHRLDHPTAGEAHPTAGEAVTQGASLNDSHTGAEAHAESGLQRTHGSGGGKPPPPCVGCGRKVRVSWRAHLKRCAISTYF